MLYTIICKDVPESASKRAPVREKHLRYVQSLVDAGRLVIAGPHPAIDSPDPGTAGFTGSLIIAEFESLDDARNWAAEDPYAKSGVFENVTVKPFVQVFP